MLHALEQIRRMRGGAQSHLMRCSDGLYYVVKFQNNPQHRRILVNEMLGTKLAARLGLPTVPVAIINVSEGLIRLTPELAITGTYAGSPAPEEEDAILERIRAANADVLCVAYGAPAQDLWIYRNLARLPVAVAMGVGGAFDFLSGRQRRAPERLRPSERERRR